MGGVSGSRCNAKPPAWTICSSAERSLAVESDPVSFRCHASLSSPPWAGDTKVRRGELNRFGVLPPKAAEQGCDDLLLI